MAVIVRRVQPDEAQELKATRLAALHDSPSAFSATYADEATRADSDWALRAGLGAQGTDRVTFLARLDGDIVGLAGGYRPEGDGNVVNLVSMWTLPAARRAGVGRALVDAVVEWARDTGASAVELWVVRGNESAQRLYEAAGFAVTGEVKPLPSDPCRDETRMRRTF